MEVINKLIEREVMWINFVEQNVKEIELKSGLYHR